MSQVREMAWSPPASASTPRERDATSGAGEVDADLARAVRSTTTLRTGFYVVVLLIALGGQVSGAMEALDMQWYVALPAVGALELGGMVVLANADVRRRLGEHATLSRLLSAAIAGGAVAFNWLAHTNHLEGGFYGGMSLLGYLVWLMNTENKRRDRLRAKRQLPPTPPAYEVFGHWLRHPWLTRRAKSLAKADPRLGLYDSIDAARTAIRTERRQAALSKVLHRKIRQALDGTTADIAVAVYDLDEIARRLAERADYDGLTSLIAADLAPARVLAGNLPAGGGRWRRRRRGPQLDPEVLASAERLLAEARPVPGAPTEEPTRPVPAAPHPHWAPGEPVAVPAPLRPRGEAVAMAVATWPQPVGKAWNGAEASTPADAGAGRTTPDAGAGRPSPDATAEEAPVALPMEPSGPAERPAAGQPDPAEQADSPERSAETEDAGTPERPAARRERVGRDAADPEAADPAERSPERADSPENRRKPQWAAAVTAEITALQSAQGQRRGSRPNQDRSGAGRSASGPARGPATAAVPAQRRAAGAGRTTTSAPIPAQRTAPPTVAEAAAAGRANGVVPLAPEEVPLRDRPLPDLVQTAATRTISAPVPVPGPGRRSMPDDDAVPGAAGGQQAGGTSRSRVYELLDQAEAAGRRDTPALAGLLVDELGLADSTARRYVSSWRRETSARED